MQIRLKFIHIYNEKEDWYISGNDLDEVFHLLSALFCSRRKKQEAVQLGKRLY